jgi:DNA-binding MarR family transcriptional regulator
LKPKGKDERIFQPDAGGRCYCTELRKASRRVSQLYDAELASNDFKITQRAVLAQIGRSEPTTVGNLAAALVMDSGGLAHTLKPLQRDGFIAISVDGSDRRNRLITLTRRGRAKLTDTQARWEAAQRAFEASMGRARIEALREALKMLASNEFGVAFNTNNAD